MSALSSLLGLAFLVSEIVLAKVRRSSNLTGVEQKDRGSLRLLWRVIGLAIAAGVLVAALRIGPKLPGHFPWAGVGLMGFVMGTLLRWWAIRHLGRFFTVDVAIAADHQLVTTGPYRWVRHPSYTGLMLQFAALAIALDNLLAFAVIVVPIFFALNRRIQVEETALQASFGTEYKKYTHGTKRLAPWVY